MPDYSSLSSVKRTFKIIEQLEGCIDGLFLSDIVAATGISKSMVSRLLSTLKKIGYIDYDEKTRRFRLSFQLLSLALRHVEKLESCGIFYPILDQISRQTGELIQAAVVTERGMYFVCIVEGKKPLMVASMLGLRAAFHATAAGKLWLASLSDEDVLRVIQKEGLKSYTPTTIITLEGLLAELKSVRLKGYAVANEEINPGVFAVALPIKDKAQNVIAAVVVAMPNFQVDQTRIEQVVHICSDVLAGFDSALLNRYSHGAVLLKESYLQ